MKTITKVLQSYDCKVIDDKVYFEDKYVHNAMQEYADQSKWVSVEERLPEVDIDVWCARSTGVLLSAFRLWKSPHSGEYLFLNYDHPFGDKEITYWMPIALPPQS